MRLATHLIDGEAALAVSGVDGEWLSAAVLSDGAVRRMDDVLRDPSVVDVLRRSLGRTVPPRAGVRAERWLPPVAPRKVIAIGRNYREHADEEGVGLPAEPLMFAKFPSSLIGHGEAIQWDPTLTAFVDFEAELAVVVGRRARHIPPERALEVVLGYTCLNDVSARDLQTRDGQWTRAKSLDTFGPLGPYLVTADEVADPNSLAIECRVNQDLMQQDSTANMIVSVRDLISHCSRSFTLEPGDVIATGTPGGVGAFRDPPVALRDGDEVSIHIEGIGRLTNPCREVWRPEA